MNKYKFKFISDHITDYLLIESKKHKDYIFFKPYTRSQFMLVNYCEYNIEMNISPIIICFKQFKMFVKVDTLTIQHILAYVEFEDLTKDQLEFFKLKFI
jgi:hypothetical protein